jgi:hypothetical protein
MMLSGLRSRLSDLERDSPKKSLADKQNDRYEKIYTSEKISVLIGIFLSLHKEFIGLLEIYRRKLYSMLPPLLFNVSLVELLKRRVD